MIDWRELKPEWGIVLGSGLGGLVEKLDVLATVPYAEIPGLPQSKVPGHNGWFVFGRIGQTMVVVAAGRVHLYEGWSAHDVAAHVRWMEARGISRLILTNAAGTLNRDFAPGTWMQITDHINLTGTSPLLGGPNFIDLSEVYSLDLRERFATAAQTEGVELHAGVYAAMLGPQYETPAEVRMVRQLGADAVGMSTIHEAIQARALRLEVAAFSCLTNWAAGITGTPLSHQEVMDTGKKAAEQLVRVITRAFDRER